MAKTNITVTTESIWLNTLLAFSKAENQDPQSSIALLWEETKETSDAHLERHIVNRGGIYVSEELRKAKHYDLTAEILDGFADVAFVALSGMRKTLVESGVPECRVEETIHKIMKTVCAANLSKLSGGKFIKDENGKIQKPKGFVPPDEQIREILVDAVNKVQ